MANGIQQTATLSTQPTVYYMDGSSSWSVTNPLLGSDSNERWVTSQPTTGIVSSSQTINLNYDHQFQVTVESNPSIAGSTEPSGSSWNTAGSVMAISVTFSNSAYFFVGWNSSSSGISFSNNLQASTTATLLGYGTIYANFAQVTISLAPNSGTVTQGAYVSATATIVGASGSASLTVSGLPSGATATFGTNPETIDLTGVTDVMNISSSLSTPPGNYQIIVTATSNGGSGTAEYSLKVIQAVPLTLGFSISDNGSTSQPVLNYTYNGVFRTVSLNSIPKIFYLDYGSTWNVTSTLSGSSSSERWITNQTTRGIAVNSATINFIYFHQFYMTFGYQITGGGSPTGSPLVTIASLGSPSVINATIGGTKAWVDASSVYSYTNSINGKTSTERWELGSNQTGKISDSAIVDPTYYHQYLIQVSFEVVGGGSGFTAPKFTFGSLGTDSNVTMQMQPMEYWADSGSSWTAPSLLNGSSGVERWESTNSSTSGTIGSSQGSLLINYQDQYFVVISDNTANGGSVQPSNGWYNASENVAISATPNSGWKFVDWKGNGLVSSNGSGSNSSILQVGGPTNETAEFYAALVIKSDSNGQLTYGYGSTEGSVAAGSSNTIYVLPGTNVSFTASPSSLIYSVNSWNVGNDSAGASSSYSMVVSSPSSVGVSFGYNYYTFAALGGVVAAVISTIGIILRKRGHGKP